MIQLIKKDNLNEATYKWNHQLLRLIILNQSYLHHFFDEELAKQLEKLASASSPVKDINFDEEKMCYLIRTDTETFCLKQKSGKWIVENYKKVN